MENANTEERASNTTGVLPNGILVALLGMQIVAVMWMLVTALNWSTEETIEDNVALYLMILPLLLMPFLVPLAVKLSRFPRFATVARNWLVYIGLAGQLFLDWLVYARFNGLFPFPLGAPLHTGWLSSDKVPLVLFAAWFNWSALVVIPLLLCSLLATSPGGNGLATRLHAGMAILAAAVGLQWGGPWSLPLNHLVWVATLMALLSVLQDRRPMSKAPAQRTYYPVFSTAGLAFIVSFWLSAPTIGSMGAPSEPWPWLACCTASVVLVAVALKRPSWPRSSRYKAGVLVAWMCCCVATVAMIMVNLSAWFAEYLVAWRVIGMATLSFSPALLAITGRVGTRRTGGRLCFTAFMVIGGMILPYLLNIFDPISSYSAFVILGLPIAMTFTSWAGRGASTRRR
ncbi:MAG: hypothetical protein JW839_10255 [Candidatus Lokiarchaeota archaeon]|nr:hypothetical protein [Candidatus Lokiarchaeota archaeon]